MSLRREPPRVDWLQIAASPRVVQSLATVTVTVAFTGQAIRALIGWPGLIGVLGGLVALTILSLLGQRGRLEWRGVLPFSLMIFLAWCALSVTWSQYTIASAGSVLYLAVFMFLGFALAISRDLIQLVRAVGDSLRFVLAVSLILEVFAGLLVDRALPFLNIAGALAHGGPIQGLGGTRNYLGFLAGLALITFATEWRTRSVSTGLAVGSVSGALIVIAFTRSPFSLVATAVVLAAGAALLLLRRVPRPRQTMVQVALLASVAVVAAVAWVLRWPIIAALNAASESEVRIGLWVALRRFIDLQQLQGWGWIGIWQREIFPFTSVFRADGRPAASALNAIVDAWFQIGAVGAAILIAAFGLAFVRSWLVSSENPIVIYVWPTLVLVLIAVTSMAESYLLYGGGMLLFVICATAAARKRSWRGRVRHRP